MGSGEISASGWLKKRRARLGAEKLKPARESLEISGRG